MFMSLSHSFARIVTIFLDYLKTSSTVKDNNFTYKLSVQYKTKKGTNKLVNLSINIEKQLS